MKIDCISDLHGYRPELEGGDLLIVAGDLTAKHTEKEHFEVIEWLEKQDYKRIIVIAGNHDTWIEENGCFGHADYDGQKIEYLCDSGINYHYYDDNFPIDDEGFLPSNKRNLKIWGSPWSPWFKGVNPSCKAFMKKDVDLLEKWELIPEETDILVTHCPPFGILDGIPIGDGSDFHVGSGSLTTEVLTKCTIKEKFPKLWVFGHIHEGYGKAKDKNFPGTIFVNASIVNERYEHVNKPIRIEI